MTDETTALRALLGTLAVGGLDLHEARRTVRRAFEVLPDGADFVYASLRGAAWWIIRLDRMPEDIAEWHDLFRHASSLARVAGRAEMAERLHAFAELVSQTARFHVRQPLNEVLSRRNVVILLTELLARGGTADHAVLADAARIGEWALPGTLFVMETLGLICRPEGPKGPIELTEGGLRASNKAAEEREGDAS